LSAFSFNVLKKNEKLTAKIAKKIIFILSLCRLYSIPAYFGVENNFSTTFV
jgi:hypothetical protein